MRYIAVVAALLLAACGAPQDQHSSELGSVRLMASTSSALLASDVASVTLSYTPQGGTTNVVVLTPSSGQAEVVLSSLVTGPYSFHAIARDSLSNNLYQGDATATVVTDETVLVSMLLQQIASSTYSNNSPIVTAFTLSPASPHVGDAVTASVTASDPQSGDITYSWSASCAGATTTFTPSDAATTTITTNCIGTMIVTGSATARGLTAAVSASIVYTPIQGADVTITWNTFPVITSITSSDTQVNVGGTVNLAVNATDSDGDMLTYAWTLGNVTGNACPTATLTNADTASPTFTAPPSFPTTGRCEIDVAVSDGRGGSATGYVTVIVSTLY